MSVIPVLLRVVEVLQIDVYNSFFYKTGHTIDATKYFFIRSVHKAP